MSVSLNAWLIGPVVVLTGLITMCMADNVSSTGSRIQRFLAQELTTTTSNAKVGCQTDHELIRMLLDVRIRFGTDVRVVS